LPSKKVRRRRRVDAGFLGRGFLGGSFLPFSGSGKIKGTFDKKRRGHAKRGRLASFQYCWRWLWMAAAASLLARVLNADPRATVPLA
jgi:hypothetical protein